ncbi:MAG: ABC transporter permease [Chitinophagales bacterium]
MWTIARLTFREMFNKKILFLGLALTVAYLVLYGVGLHYTAKGMSKVSDYLVILTGSQFLTAGIYVSALLVSAITVFTAVGALSSEIENGIIQAIVAKPLRRRDIYLGKYIGLGLVLTGYSLLVFIANVLIVYLTMGFKSDDYIGAGVLFTLVPLVLLAITLWGSSFLSTLANGIIVFILYSLSLVGGIVEQVGLHLSSMAGVHAGQQVTTGLTNTGVISSLIMPVDSIYRLVNYLLVAKSEVPIQVTMFNPFATMAPPSSYMLVYTGLYLLVFILWGIKIFSQRDI